MTKPMATTGSLDTLMQYRYAVQHGLQVLGRLKSPYEVQCKRLHAYTPHVRGMLRVLY